MLLDIQELNWNNQYVHADPRACTVAKPSKHCCLWQFTINLLEHFNFIIHPEKLEINYCAGTCELGFSMVCNVHAKLAMASAADISHTTDKPSYYSCCVPQKLSSAKILFLDENKNIVVYVLKKYSNC